MVPVEDVVMDTHESGIESPATITAVHERAEQVKAYIARLPENQANVIILKFEKGYSYQEISEQTGLSTGNIGFLIHTGMKRLRELLPDELR